MVQSKKRIASIILEVQVVSDTTPLTNHNCSKYHLVLNEKIKEYVKNTC